MLVTYSITADIPIFYPGTNYEIEEEGRQSCQGCVQFCRWDTTASESTERAEEWGPVR